MTPDSNNEVLTHFGLPQNVDLNGWTCQSGYSFAGGQLTLDGEASNYFGHSQVSQIVFVRQE
jgi:hypothetical protein